MAESIALQWLLLIGAFHILSVKCQDCKWVGSWRGPCPEGYNEVFKEPDGTNFQQYCCKAGSSDETYWIRKAPMCRATECLSSSGNALCSSLDRYINGTKLEYEEVMQDPCTRGQDGGQGVLGYCCQRDSQEGVLVTSLGAEAYEFPHQAKIKPVDCGGTVYNSRYVITAAHCIVDGNGVPKDAKEMKVVVGTNIGDMDLNAKEYVYQVKQIIPHERYSKLASNDQNERDNQKRTYNDIALLELEKEIKFSNHVKSLEIAPANFDPFAYADNAVIVGWGTTETLALAIHLQKANFILRRDKSCFEGHGKWWNFEDKKDQLLCVGGIMNGQYSWTAGGGDSGGPAICRKADGNPVLCGVTSFGANDTACQMNSDESSSSKCLCRGGAFSGVHRKICERSGQ